MRQLKRCRLVYAGVLVFAACTESTGPLQPAHQVPGTQVPGTATKLIFTRQPSTVSAGSSITPAVVVTALDAIRNTATGFTGPVTLALGANPGNTTVSGTRTVTAVAGVATFNALSVPIVGAGYTLIASAPGLTGATSTAFDVTAAPLIAFEAESVAFNQVQRLGIATMTTEGGNIVNLTKSGGKPAWSPDRTRIAFVTSVGGGGGVAVMNADGSGLDTILPVTPPSGFSDVAWKPDGSRLAVSGSYKGAVGLFIVAPDGSNPSQIVSFPPGWEGGAMSPSWSPDGSRLALNCPPGTSTITGICVVNADGSALTQVAPVGLYPAWKPDGTRILFLAINGCTSCGLTLINPDGSGATSLGINGWFPAWSSDGQHIAYVVLFRCAGLSSYHHCGTARPDFIWVANADGTGAHVVGPGIFPAWAP